MPDLILNSKVMAWSWIWQGYGKRRWHLGDTDIQQGVATMRRCNGEREGQKSDAAVMYGRDRGRYGSQMVRKEPIDGLDGGVRVAMDS